MLILKPVWYLVDGHTRVARKLREEDWWGWAYVLRMLVTTEEAEPMVGLVRG